MDRARSMRWLRRAALSGHSDACCALAQCYATGDGLEWLDAADTHGTAQAGRARPASKRNQKLAFEWYQRAADAPNPSAEALYHLGLAYQSGLEAAGVKANALLAAEHMSRAAALNHRDAQLALAVVYSNGLAAAADPSRRFAKNQALAFDWFLKAAHNGSADAMFNVGLCYALGQGTQPNAIKELEWYLKAAGTCRAPTSCATASAFVMGNAPHTCLMAVRLLFSVWFCSCHGSENGLPRAMYNLGVMHERGEGVRPDEKKAFDWYQKASEGSWLLQRLALRRCDESRDAHSKRGVMRCDVVVLQAVFTMRT